MASSNLLLIIEVISALICDAIAIYATIWAFKIRQALFFRVYRNQALGIGIIALILVIFASVFGTGENFDPSLAGYAPWYIQGVSLVLLYWINASIMAGRRTDPLRRNTAHWEKLRFIILGLCILEIISSAVISIISPEIFLPTHILPAFWLFSPLFETLGAGAVILPIVARRSRDHTLRKHLAWFGLLGVVLIVAAVFGIVTFRTAYEVENSLGFPFLLIVATYCLYKSVKSLIPLNHLSLEEVEQKT